MSESSGAVHHYSVEELLAGCEAAKRDPLLRAILVHHNSGGDPELVRAAMLDVLEEYDVGLGTLQEMDAELHSNAVIATECASAVLDEEDEKTEEQPAHDNGKIE